MKIDFQKSLKKKMSWLFGFQSDFESLHHKALSRKQRKHLAQELKITNTYSMLVAHISSSSLISSPGGAGSLENNSSVSTISQFLPNESWKWFCSL